MINGEPIITLPPKIVTLKKVDFSEGERAFYTNLEAESREQFKVHLCFLIVFNCCFYDESWFLLS